jgi:hypothetical protein
MMVRRVKYSRMWPPGAARAGKKYSSIAINKVCRSGAPAALFTAPAKHKKIADHTLFFPAARAAIPCETTLFSNRIHHPICRCLA